LYRSGGAYLLGKFVGLRNLQGVPFQAPPAELSGDNVAWPLKDEEVLEEYAVPVDCGCIESDDGFVYGEDGDIAGLFHRQKGSD
jgi:hypothetical protein